MGEIFIFFLYFRIFAIFSKYMKNKIGILENDIYIFPIVNSVILLIWYCKCTGQGCGSLNGLLKQSGEALHPCPLRHAGHAGHALWHSRPGTPALN